MDLELRTVPEFGVAETVALLNRGFADYAVTVQATLPNFLGMAAQEGIQLPVSRVVLQEGEAVGLALIARRGWSSRLAGMAILSEARGQGIGRWLMQRLIEEARQRGERRMVLEVIEGNEPAVRLYQSCGFQVRRRLVGFSAADLEVEPPGDAPPLSEVDIREVARWVINYGIRDLPWQVSGETLAQVGPPSRAYRLGEAAAVLSNPEAERVAIRSLLVRPSARRQGQAVRLLRLLLARHPGKTWVVPALCPEEIGCVFEKVGFVQGELAQLQMFLAWKET